MKQIQELCENRTISLKGSLCFSVADQGAANVPCILLSNQSSAWLKEAAWGNGGKVVANASVIYGWWPRFPVVNTSTAPPRQPKLAPFCRGEQTEELTLPWTGCQSRGSAWAVEGLFSFPPIWVWELISHPWTPCDPTLTLLTNGCSVALMEAALILHLRQCVKGVKVKKGGWSLTGKGLWGAASSQAITLGHLVGLPLI